MALYYKIVATCAKNDVYHVGFLKKVEELHVAPLNDGYHAIFFKSNLSLSNVRVRTSEMKRKLGMRDARPQELTKDDWVQQRAATAQQDEAASSSQASEGTVCCRSGLQDVMAILPTLTDAERNLLFAKLAMLRAPSCITTQVNIARVKMGMQTILNTEPVSSWGELLKPYVDAASQPPFDFLPSTDREMNQTWDGLRLLFRYPPLDGGLKKTRNTSLDPKVVEVINTRKLPFPVVHMPPPRQPWKWPTKPPPNLDQYFLVDMRVGDQDGNWGPVFTVEYPYFAENKSWAEANDFNMADWASTEERWLYDGSIHGRAFDKWLSERHMQRLEREARLDDDAPDIVLMRMVEEDEQRRKAEHNRKRSRQMLTIEVEEGIITRHEVEGVSASAALENFVRRRQQEVADDVMTAQEFEELSAAMKRRRM